MPSIIPFQELSCSNNSGHLSKFETTYSPLELSALRFRLNNFWTIPQGHSCGRHATCYLSSFSTVSDKTWQLGINCCSYWRWGCRLVELPGRSTSICSQIMISSSKFLSLGLGPSRIAIWICSWWFILISFQQLMLLNGCLFGSWPHKIADSILLDASCPKSCLFLLVFCCGTSLRCCRFSWKNWS